MAFGATYQESILKTKTLQRTKSAADAELSRKLAVAIGWNDDVENPKVVIESYVYDNQHQAKVLVEADWTWRVFDYRDSRTWGPIEAKFGVWFRNPKKSVWEARCKGHRTVADSMECAGALAVIAAAGRQASPPTVVRPADDFPGVPKRNKK
jgi:hypothetical protein